MLRFNLDMFEPFFPPALLLTVCGAGQATSPALERTVLAMGTELRFHLEGPRAAAGSEAALAECARIEASCSTWDSGSAWSLLNAAQGRAVVLDREWLALLGQMKTWSGRTEGAFDPALMALMRAWGVREGGRTPSPEVLGRARGASGAALLELDEATGTACLREARAGVEEGGFLKGYALDRMRKATGARSGWIDFGGQILAWGAPRAVSIAAPADRQRPCLDLDLRNASLACSGTSERGRHILDPRSGEPCAAWGATAVVASDALTADVLSTALYVLGPDQGLVWAECHDVAAVFLLQDGGVRMTRSFRALHPTTRSLELK
jgi:thiamine biosynthesis lipoprotein